MTRSIIVSVDGVTQSPNDFKLRGNTIIFNFPPPSGGSWIEFTTITGAGTNKSSHWGDGVRTNFPLPSWPKVKFEVIRDSKESVPAGYSVVDVNHEIESWIRDNCAIHEWKWADQLDGTSLLAGGFGMVRLILKDSIVTYIATRWSA